MKKVLEDKEELLEALKNYGFLAFSNASEELKSDKEVVLAAVSRSGMALQFAAEAMRSDKEVVLAAIRNQAEAYEFALGEARADREVIDATLKAALDYVSRPRERKFRGFMKLPKIAFKHKEIVLKAFENGADFGELYDETIIDEDIAEAIFASNGPKETFETAADAYGKLVELAKIVRIFNKEVRYEENYAEDLDADTQMLESDLKMLDLMSFFVGNIHILMEDADDLKAAMAEVSTAMKFEEGSYKFVQHWNDWKNIFDTIKSYISENGICEASYNYYRDTEKLIEKAIEWSKEMAMYRYSHCGAKIGGVFNVVYHASREVAIPVLLSECWK